MYEISTSVAIYLNPRECMIAKITHLSVFVDSQDEALAFYTEKLGFKLHTDVMHGPDMRWLTITPADQPSFEIALMQANTPEEKALVGKQALHYPMICVETADTKKTYAELKEKGVTFTEEPNEQPWGISVTFKDLYGNSIYMVQPTAQ